MANHLIKSRIGMKPSQEMYDRIHFAVMAIESAARKMNVSGRRMHDRLKAQNLIHDRLLARYDDLHTQSLDWVADDTVTTLKNWEAGVYAAIPNHRHHNGGTGAWAACLQESQPPDMHSFTDRDRCVFEVCRSRRVGEDLANA